MQRHDRRVAVGHHVDRQFVVAAEQESRRNQLRSLERLDRHGTPRRGGHLAVHLPPHDNHQARIGRIPAGYQLAVAVIGQRVVPAAVDNFMDLIFRQPSEQRALGQYGIHSVRIMFVFRCCQTTGEITYFPDDFQKLARYGSGSTVERPQEHPARKTAPGHTLRRAPCSKPFPETRRYSSLVLSERTTTGPSIASSGHGPRHPVLSTLSLGPATARPRKTPTSESPPAADGHAV